MPARLIIAVLGLLWATAATGRMEEAASDSATSHATFSTVEDWASSLDDDNRHRWQQPKAVVDSLRVHPGQRIADIGAGTGYFNALFADALGPTGRLFAIEIEPELVEHMRERATAEGTPQVECILGAADDPCLPDRLDLVFFCNTYRYIDGRRAYMARVREGLRPGGRVAVVDFRQSARDTTGWRLPPERVIAEMESVGLELVEEFDFLGKQYFLIFGQPVTDQLVEADEAIFTAAIDAAMWAASEVQVFRVDGRAARDHADGGRGEAGFGGVAVLGGEEHGYRVTELGAPLAPAQQFELKRLVLGASSYTAGSHACTFEPTIAVRFDCEPTDYIVCVDTDCWEVRLLDESGDLLRHRLAADTRPWLALIETSF